MKFRVLQNYTKKLLASFSQRFFHVLLLITSYFASPINDLNRYMSISILNSIIFEKNNFSILNSKILIK